MKTGRSLPLLSQKKFVSILQYGRYILGNGATRKILIYTIKFIKESQRFDQIRQLLFQNPFYFAKFTNCNRNSIFL